ncbi:hypothetical protein FA09DRAFT_239496 [Tilletiopsis washingtonensis]|uniref:Uncharacterized protein n=1 Tax=Tilletiopsis washingtonensis TaxID=58919 RepID=A0A316ZFB0_9BASI|nr:hypothetical protein FA09DRAFT_239496 [Tilletiopsis washingtonensis]PWN99035.1 hypothetical protein FA09DRAFT_239496 [Tilletiopsis washingtonensis]
MINVPDELRYYSGGCSSFTILMLIEHVKRRRRLRRDGTREAISCVLWLASKVPGLTTATCAAVRPLQLSLHQGPACAARSGTSMSLFDRRQLHLPCCDAAEREQRGVSCRLLLLQPPFCRPGAGFSHV